ncbi:unnamed protein product [Zymoseptoria tritici ST99CH_3D1]|nr:unnamed protein product [Zymoseptoria tritici ST99CH_3D1]
MVPPPVELPAEPMAAFDNLTTTTANINPDVDINPDEDTSSDEDKPFKPYEDSNSDKDIKPDANIKSKERRPIKQDQHFVIDHRPVKFKGPTPTHRIIKRGGQPLSNAATHRASHFDESSVKRTLLPSGFTVPEFLQAEDVWDLRQAGDKRVSGISVVFYAGAEENGSVDLEEEAKQF